MYLFLEKGVKRGTVASVLLLFYKNIEIEIKNS